MAIVQLKKLTFCGLLKDKKTVLAQLQQLGGLHLISLKKAPATFVTDELNQANLVVDALKFLAQCKIKRHQIVASIEFDFMVIVKEALSIKEKIRKLSDERDALLKRIKEIEPWGDFDLPPDNQMANQKLWFYIVPKKLMAKVKSSALIWQVVYQNNLSCYVVVIAEQEPAENIMPVPRTHTGQLSLSELIRHENRLALELEDLQAERESLTRWMSLIVRHLAEAQDQADLNNADSITHDEAEVFALQGWLPVKQIDEYQHFAEQHQLALLIEDPAPEDNPPTLLENMRPVAGGGDMISFYQTPGYHAWDPSIAVFFSFCLFFAMILSDAGYAFVLALLLAIKWRSLGRSDKGQRLRLLAAATVVVAIVWGIFAGGYFGYSPPETTFAGSLKIIDLNDFSSMMRLSIAVGVLHIALANCIQAYQLKNSLKALASIGWALLVMGGFGLWTATTTENLLWSHWGYALCGVGVFCLIFFSSDRPVNRLSDFFWRILNGLKSFVNITKLFGDVLSYMRLFALGLASASLALTFNDLAVQIYHEVPGLGLLFSIVILLLGHTLNLMLCLMSGLVHGLRLNFIEFYNWSVSDEGYPFRAFSKKGVD